MPQSIIDMLRFIGVPRNATVIVLVVVAAVFSGIYFDNYTRRFLDDEGKLSELRKQESDDRSELSRQISGVRVDLLTQLNNLDIKLDQQITKLNQRMDAERENVSGRLDGLTRAVSTTNEKLGAVEEKARSAEETAKQLSSRVDAIFLNQKRGEVTGAVPSVVGAR